MKKLMLALALTSLPVTAMAVPPKAKAKIVAKPASAKLLPVFEFLGQNTETPTTMTNLNGTACTAEGTKLECSDFKYPTIGGQRLQYLAMNFNNGKLYTVLGSFGQVGFTTLRAAFTAKYGELSKIETRKWQNKAGATFDNLVVIWQFRGGDLELAAMGSRINDGMFQFLHLPNAPEPDAPKVDF